MTNLETLKNAGIIDLGGTGAFFLEIEYNNNRGEFQEAVFRLPQSYSREDIIQAKIHTMDSDQISVILLEFPKDHFHIHLSDICSELVEIRLPGVDGENITDMFSEKN